MLPSARKIRIGFLEPPESQGQGGKEQEIQGGGGEQAAEDDRGHRAFDFASGLTTAPDQRQQTQSGDQRGHQDGEQSFRSADQGGFQGPGMPFYFDQMVVM